MNTGKSLVLVRGHVGSGKTEFARAIAPRASIAADDWFDKYNKGVFDGAKLRDAHNECRARALMLMSSGERVIAIHNTFVRNEHMEPYFKLAKKYGYRVRVVTMNGSYQNTKKVPDYVLKRYHNQWEDLDMVMVNRIMGES